MQNKIFTKSITVQESYLDSFGHVNNAMYLTLLEDARWDLITQNGYGLNKIKESGLGPTILEIKINFKRELLLNDKITIETQVISLQKKTCVILQKMIRDDVLCCEAEFVVGLFNLQERKLVIPTPDWLKAIGVHDYE